MAPDMAMALGTSYNPFLQERGPTGFNCTVLWKEDTSNHARGCLSRQSCLFKPLGFGARPSCSFWKTSGGGEGGSGDLLMAIL